MDLSQLIGGPTWQIPPFFSYLLMGIAVLLLAVALLAALPLVRAVAQMMGELLT